ncbi:heavy metal translocating P-type ATPase [Arhodomonas sp. AD133]|uniref:heavy metal translocating P-type ATPase n=1 Tax=Arhodomonas sp. AD133 TaxID=3415009 RepID=UPI003EC0D1A5
MNETVCFHCGDPMPRGERRTVEIDGVARPVCCPGCEAVASLIAGQGLSDFYRFRNGASARPETDRDDQWQAWDRAELQASHVTEHDDGTCGVTLMAEGITCSACTWLIEHALANVPGVVDIQANPATARVMLRWQPSRIPLSRLLRRIAGLGYRPHPVGSDSALSVPVRERRAALKRLAVAGLGMMQVMMYAVALYAGAIHDDMDPVFVHFLRTVSLLVATPVVFYAGAPFFRGAWRDIRARRPGMDVPVALAIGAAYAASLWHTFFGGGEVYFDSVTMFIFFLTVARFLEMTARHRANRGLETLAGLLPSTAVRVVDGVSERVAASELRAGDRVRVAAGEAVPADGRILEGHTHLDESMLTGEYRARSRAPGDAISAGTVNAGNAVEMRIERLADDTLLASIVRLLEQAQSRRPAITQLADRIARHFVTAVLIAAAATGVVWWHLEPSRAFEIVLAVLVISCPCALSLATPAALVSATGRLARQGVLVAHPGALETLARADRVVLDKTGTLTRGRITIQRIDDRQGLGEAQCARLAAALEAHSAHPLAAAFRAWHDGLEANAVVEHRGDGVEGMIAGQRLRLGRPAWVAALSRTEAPSQSEAHTLVALGDETGIIASFALADELRQGAAEAVAGLASEGLHVEIASGDAESAVATVANAAGVDDWYSSMRPADKLTHIDALQARDHRVVMVGDGVNDAPVLAGADVAVAIGAGSALARANADLILLSEDLATLGEARRVARRSVATIRQNLAWAACYNVAALPLAASGVLAPWLAAIGMSLSSLVVVGNALRLARDARTKTPHVAHPATTREAAA